MNSSINDEDLDTAYVQLGTPRRRKHQDTAFNDVNCSNSNLLPPVDHYNAIYLSLVLAGVGFLLPYNSFIMAADYFGARYPASTVVFDMSIVYIVVAFIAVLVNNVLVEMCSLNARITFGYVLSLLTLLFVAFCEIGWEAFGPSLSYTVNLSAVAVVAVGCTVQQSSLYGFTSMLPSRYTQAVMAGESAAGFWVSLNRILTKLLLSDERQNTIIFFLLSIMLVGLSCVMYQVIRGTSFVHFYVTLCQERSRIVLEPNEDMGLMDTGDQDRPQYGVLKIQSSPPPMTSPLTTNIRMSTGGEPSLFTEEPLETPLKINDKYTSFSFSNPVYDLSNNVYDPSTNIYDPNISTSKMFKVEDVVIRGSTGRCGNIKRALQIRWRVAGNVYPYMVAIALAYFVTLCLYPGIETEIISCRWGTWMPVILMAAFNTADLIGKILASVPYEWSRRQLVVMSASRVFLVPLLLLCAAPRTSPVVAGEGYPIIFSALLGLTNGLVGSIPMIQAPQRVPQEFREITGNIMTLSYNIGLTGGSLVAYLLNSMLGPSLANPCKILPPISPLQNVTLMTSIATVVTTAATTLMSIVTHDISVTNNTVTDLTTLSTIYNITTHYPWDDNISSFTTGKLG